MSKPSSYNKGEGYFGGALTVAGALAANGAVTVGGQLTVSGPTKNVSASAPTAAAGANAGTTPPAPVVVTGSIDTAGSITFGSGSGSPAAGDYVDVTFGTAFATAPRSVSLTPMNTATATKGPVFVSAITTTGFTINLNVAAATSQANTVYAVGYAVHP